jgi:hypothetical protein
VALSARIKRPLLAQLAAHFQLPSTQITRRKLREQAVQVFADALVALA